jgi:hypothetical protein
MWERLMIVVYKAAHIHTEATPIKKASNGVTR